MITFLFEEKLKKDSQICYSTSNRKINNIAREIHAIDERNRENKFLKNHSKTKTYEN